MASNNNEERWYFTKEQLDNSPSRQCGIEAYKELSYRQQAANFIQDLGQRLKVSQLCINTAIVYMHRFYVFHSFTHFPWHLIASAALFLAAKVEEQPRKLEHVIRVANLCKNPRDTTFDTTSERYLAQSQDLVFNENVLLQTLGFDVAIDHPNTHVVKCCHLVRASKDLAQTSYFMASNSLHLTTMCLQYKPTVVACFCIHLACKWSNWEIPLSNEKKEWFSYVDPTVTAELLQQLTEEFLVIFERCPSRLKEKIRLVGDGQIPHHPSPPLEDEKRVAIFMPPEQKEPHSHRSHHLDSKASKVDDPYKRTQKLPHDASSSNQRDRDKEREYRERKERERLAGKYPASMSVPNNKHMPPPHGHHSHMASTDVKMKLHGRAPHPSSSGHQNITRVDGKNVPREVLIKEHGREVGNEAINRDVPKETPHVPGDKDFQKQQRDNVVSQRHDMKSNVTNDVNCDVNLNDSRISFNSDKRSDVPRTSAKVPVDPKLSMNKQEFARKREEHKTNIKLETDIKKHLSSEYLDKNSSLLDNSQKVKSPLVSDLTNKMAPNQSLVKIENSSFNNANKNNFNSLPSLLDVPDIKTVVPEKDIQLPIKRPSLFSPEASPPKIPIKTSPSFSSNPVLDIPKMHPPQEPPKASTSYKRSRTSSNSSEPELRPVMKKIDQVEGFENLMRDSSIGLKLQVPDIITPITERSDVHPSIAKDMKPPDLILPFPKPSNATTSTAAVVNSHPLVNGIETNPTLISNLLKEAPTIPHLQTVAIPTQSDQVILNTESKEKDREHHKERKKNKKEKHKHKDKSKEEKEKKKKHKDKDKEKHKHKHENPTTTATAPEVVAQPIKITISKDKIQPPENLPTSSGLKIKIPKDRIKTESLENPTTQNSPGELKIRISKGFINFPNDNSKKREREKSTPGVASAGSSGNGGPPSKMSRSNHGRPSGEPKQNGRNSYNSNKVSEPYRTQMLNSSSEQTRPPDAAVINSMPTFRPPSVQQRSNYFFNYPPPNMQLPPPHGLAMPPNFMYPSVFQQYYPSSYMYPPQPPLPPNVVVPPPLPQEPPPNKPPPPPE